MRTILISEITKLKNALNYRIIIFFIFLKHFNLMKYFYYTWKLFLLIIFLKFIYYSILGVPSTFNYKFNLKLQLIRTINNLTTYLAINILKSAKSEFFNLSSILITVYSLAIRALIIICLGYSIKFIRLISEILNEYFIGIKSLKQKSLTTKLRGYVYFLKKSIIQILENEFISNF